MANRRLHIIGFGGVGQAFYRVLQKVIPAGDLPQFKSVDYWYPAEDAASGNPADLPTGSLPITFNKIAMITRETLASTLDAVSDKICARALRAAPRPRAASLVRNERACARRCAQDGAIVTLESAANWDAGTASDPIAERGAEYYPYAWMAAGEGRARRLEIHLSSSDEIPWLPRLILRLAHSRGRGKRPPPSRASPASHPPPSFSLRCN